ncbi:hypothetical protein [Bartonella bilalgolemii]|uniref:TrwN protein n=1 Tax=Bartonella bilalgolemii TaxID=2942911 RepID=A0ABT0P982_9HYPH|nr:hypothetical protein [Bartonella sp. G70]MCL6230029.1 hypothetical protein [Bartonella sp. G70]
MMKSLSITRIITFIAFFSISALPASASFGFIDKLTRMFTSVDTIEKYNRLYNKYVSETYIGSMHSEKIRKAEKLSLSQGTEYAFFEQEDILYRHISVLGCASFMSLLRGDYNKVMSQMDLPNVIKRLRDEYDWSESDFMWAYDMVNDNKDPMIYYAKKLSMTIDKHYDFRKEQVDNIVSQMKKNDHKKLKGHGEYCRNLQTIFNIMKP